MSRAIVLTHVCSLVGWLAGAAGFFGLGLSHADSEPRTVYDTVHLGAFAAVGILAYSLAFECLRVCTPVRWGLRRRREPHSDYVDAQGVSDGVTVVVLGVPKLTMESVWSLVYGLGMVFFVALYCFSAQQPVCYYSFSIGLVALCVEEASVHSGDCNRCFPYLAATAMAGVAILLVTADLGFLVEDTDLFGVVWGMLLPACTPLLFWSVRTNRQYTLGSVMELCEFGMPFASIVGILYICVMDGEAFHDMSYDPGLNATALYRHADPGLLITAIASPWLLVPCVVFFAGAVLQSRTVDPLVAIAIVVSGQHLVARPDSSLSLSAALLALSAAGVRIWSVEAAPRAAPAVRADAGYEGYGVDEP